MSKAKEKRYVLRDDWNKDNEEACLMGRGKSFHNLGMTSYDLAWLMTINCDLTVTWLDSWRSTVTWLDSWRSTVTWLDSWRSTVTWLDSLRSAVTGIDSWLAAMTWQGVVVAAILWTGSAVAAILWACSGASAISVIDAVSQSITHSE